MHYVGIHIVRILDRLMIWKLTLNSGVARIMLRFDLLLCNFDTDCGSH